MRGAGWVPQDLLEVSSSVSRKRVPPIPWSRGLCGLSFPDTDAKTLRKSSAPAPPSALNCWLWIVVSAELIHFFGVLRGFLPHNLSVLFESAFFEQGFNRPPVLPNRDSWSRLLSFEECQASPCCETTTSVVHPSLCARSMSKRRPPAGAPSTKNRLETGSEKKRQLSEWPPSEPDEECSYTWTGQESLGFSADDMLQVVGREVTSHMHGLHASNDWGMLSLWTSHVALTYVYFAFQLFYFQASDMMHFGQLFFLLSLFWVFQHTRMFRDIHVCINVVNKHTYIFAQQLNLHPTPPLLFAPLEVSHEAWSVCFSLCERVYVCVYTCIYMYIQAYIYIYPYVCTHTHTWICSYSPPLENHTGITLVGIELYDGPDPYRKISITWN